MNLIDKFINKQTLTIEDLKKKDICILCATTSDYYSLMNYFHKKNLRWLSNDLPYEFIPEQLEVNDKPVYVKIVENKEDKFDNRIIMYSTGTKGLKAYDYQNIELI